MVRGQEALISTSPRPFISPFFTLSCQTIFYFYFSFVSIFFLFVLSYEYFLFYFFKYNRSLYKLHIILNRIVEFQSIYYIYELGNQILNIIKEFLITIRIRSYVKYIIKKIIFDIYNISHFHQNIKRYAKKILTSNQFNLEKKAKWRKLNLILRMKEKKKKKKFVPLRFYSKRDNPLFLYFWHKVDDRSIPGILALW